MAAAFWVQMSGQMPGWPAATRVMSRNPPAARRSRAPCSTARLPARFIRVAAVRWGTCDTMATRVSWLVGRERHHLGPEAAHRRPQAGEGIGIGVGGGGEHPGGPDEQLGVGPLDAILFGAGHGMAADEAGVGQGCPPPAP